MHDPVARHVGSTLATRRRATSETDWTWWRDGVLYQIYPRSFADSNGDGIGDLPGITAHLDYLEWLGVDAIWLSPISASPNDDWGYDVADYCSVDPDLGTLADADRLMEEAASRGIRVMLDLVPNHTSDRHPWFVDARSSRRSRYRDFYVWADPGPGGGPPNNWVNAFGPSRPAWTLDPTSGQYYLHHFLPSQPDLNWWNDGVREAFDQVLRFWFDRGVAGFRIDVCSQIVKDRELRDNPPAGPGDHPVIRRAGQRPIYNSYRPELHQVLRRWRAIADSYHVRRALLGETAVFDPQQLASFYGQGDELHLAYNFMLQRAPFALPELCQVVERTEAALPATGWPVWAAGSHDISRYPTRWAEGDAAKTRCIMVMLAGLRGTPLLYYGEELGMPDTAVPHDRVCDRGRQSMGGTGRDPARTPMPWEPVPGAGFTAPGVEPWLPVGDITACNVADQVDDPSSILSLTRDVVRLRARLPSLRRGSYRTHPGSEGELWAWWRGDDVIVALNLSDARASVPGVQGAVLLCTDRSRDGERVEAVLELAPREAAIVGLEV